MSRSALARQEKMRQKQQWLQQQLPQPAVQLDEERKPKANEVPMYGNERTYNLNAMLFENVSNSSYFKSLYSLRTYHEVVDEIYNRVDHAEPLAKGTSRVPSSCFCLLLKCFTMRLTIKQMQGLLNHGDSAFIRCVGFLYLRYTCPPDKLFEWFEPYLSDSEEFNASSNTAEVTTIGKWIRQLIEEQHYFDTILPRLPKKILDSIKVKLLIFDRKIKRRFENQRFKRDLRPGTKVRAMYADADNEPAMYDAVIDTVEENEMFSVTFPQYGNSERVDLGDIEILRSRSRSRSSSPRYRRHRSRSRELTTDLLKQVRERDREKAAAVGKGYAQRVTTYKDSLSMKADRYTTRKRSRSRERPSYRSKRPSRSRSRSPPRRREEYHHRSSDRMDKLRQQYGDASKKN